MKTISNYKKNSVYSLILGLLLISAVIIPGINCKKDTAGRAVVTVIRPDKSAIEGAKVVFYIDTDTIRKGALNDTLITNSKGEVTFERSHDCYPDVMVIHFENGYRYSGYLNIKVIRNKTYRDTITLR